VSGEPTNADSIENLIGYLLRGAAKILGCSSANLLLFDRKSRKIRIRVGTVAERHAQLGQVEAMLGGAVQRIPISMDKLKESLVYAAWQDRTIRETGSFAELVGRAFPRPVVARVSSRLRDQRFLCVPVVYRFSAPGVIIFTKEGRRPFGPQRREILLRYAQRIGGIVENEVIGSGSTFVRRDRRFPSGTAVAQLIFDRRGELVDRSPAAQPESGDPDLSAVLGAAFGELSAAARKVLSSAASRGEIAPLELPSTRGDEARPRYRSEISRVEIRGEPFALFRVYCADPASDHPIDSHLLQFALGETAPAILVDPSYRITSCNRATERLMGYTNDELDQQPVSTLFRDPTDIATILNHRFLSLSDGYFEDLIVVRHKDGRLLSSKVEALLLADEHNSVIGYLLLLRDRSRLEGVREGASDARRLMRRERLASMGEMAAQLAHELRNPLISIGATLETLSRDERRGAEDRSMLEQLSREVTHADLILQDYLSLSVRRNISVERIELSQVVDDALSLFSNTNGCNSTRINSTVQPGLEVLADYLGLLWACVRWCSTCCATPWMRPHTTARSPAARCATTTTSRFISTTTAPACRARRASVSSRSSPPRTTAPGWA
jgi:PAS domain S-box-containing protein